MKLIAAALALLTTSVAATQVQYDTAYDDSNGWLGNVACSDGDHGLLTRGYTTFGSLPRFPHIGAVDAITGWNSNECGSCWKLSYEGREITVLGIDVAGFGFNIAEAAMNELTNGRAQELGNIQVDSWRVDSSECGL